MQSKCVANLHFVRIFANVKYEVSEVIIVRDKMDCRNWQEYISTLGWSIYKVTDETFE